MATDDASHKLALYQRLNELRQRHAELFHRQQRSLPHVDKTTESELNALSIEAKSVYAEIKSLQQKDVTNSPVTEVAPIQEFVKAAERSRALLEPGALGVLDREVGRAAQESTMEMYRLVAGHKDFEKWAAENPEQAAHMKAMLEAAKEPSKVAKDAQPRSQQSAPSRNEQLVARYGRPVGHQLIPDEKPRETTVLDANGKATRGKEIIDAYGRAVKPGRESVQPGKKGREDILPSEE